MWLQIPKSERTRSLKSVLLIVPVLLVLSIFYLLPILRLLYSSFFDPHFTLKHYIYFAQNPLYFKILFRTFEMAFFVTIVSLLLSYPVAFLLAEARGKTQYFMFCVILPFWTSLLVRTYAWMVLLQVNGLINKYLMGIGFTSEPIPLMYNTLGVLVGMVHVLLPFMILPIYSVLKGIDKDLTLAAYTLGANKFRAFWAITVPLSMPGIAAGVIFVFVLSLGFFITPALLGGPKVTMIATLIENQVNELNNWSFAAAIALVLLAFTALILGLFSKVINFDRFGGRA
jgi:ABC-type spermidine/putrescine transport system permease subunit I